MPWRTNFGTCTRTSGVKAAKASALEADVVSATALSSMSESEYTRLSQVPAGMPLPETAVPTASGCAVPDTRER